MNAVVRTLTEEAKKLAPEERFELAEAILASVDPDSEIERQWLTEVQDRIEAVNRGELALVDADEVFAKLSRK